MVVKGRELGSLTKRQRGLTKKMLRDMCTKFWLMMSEMTLVRWCKSEPESEIHFQCLLA